MGLMLGRIESNAHMMSQVLLSPSLGLALSLLDSRQQLFTKGESGAECPKLTSFSLASRKRPLSNSLFQAREGTDGPCVGDVPEHKPIIVARGTMATIGTMIGLPEYLGGSIHDSLS